MEPIHNLALRRRESTDSLFGTPELVPQVPPQPLDQRPRVEAFRQICRLLCWVTSDDVDCFKAPIDNPAVRLTEK